MALPQRLLEGIVQRILGNGLAIEIGSHQLLVYLDHLIENLGMRISQRKDVGLAVGLEKSSRVRSCDRHKAD